MPAQYDIEPYDPCPCGSGKKYKFCCAGKRKETSHGKYPLGTVAYYGPDDKTTTKIAAGAFATPDSEVVIKRWVGDENITSDENVAREIKQFFAQRGVRSVVVSDGVMGCPHETGVDFPPGQDCPYCPWWRGKQKLTPYEDGQIDEWDDEEEDDDLDEEEDDYDDTDEEAEAFGQDRDFDASFARIDAILGDKKLDQEQALEIFLAHLKAHLQLPCEVKGSEDFRWEEPYVIGGWSPAEYRRLRKTQPSYLDRFELLSIDLNETSEWMMFGEDIAAHVRRKPDGKEFVLGLAELKATDRKSLNYQLIDDYAVWLVNYR